MKFLLLKSLRLLAVSISIPTAFATTVLPDPIYGSNQGPAMSSTLLRDIDDYQLGSEWGKKPVLKSDLKSKSKAFQRAAFATARVGGGTGFYLGKFGGLHLMATNHHVCPAARQCVGKQAQFTLMGKSYPIIRFLGHWTQIDLAVLAISVPEQEEAALRPVGRAFAWHEVLESGDPLITIGYGVAGNSSRQLMANEDSDCKVFSGRGEYRFMADPDEYNPGEYQAWSFANGCDVSHGDSGSAMVARNSGKVVGIIWTGRIPKSASVQNSEELDRILRSGGREIWQELSYAVPAAKMFEVLSEVVQKPGLDPVDAQALSELLRSE